MALPGNGIFVVRGEMSTLMTAMKRGAARWNSTSYQDEEQDGLMKQFIELKQILNQIDDLKLIDPNVYLGPFLDVIRTEETTGAVTSLALSAINKFLSYGLIDPTHSTLAATVENIADAVTHARFMGTDQASDGVTIMRVVEVLHTLMRSPEGSALTNESVCEVMLSCFKICFEPRLNELLRRTAEQALKDMVLLLFMRLPQFSEDNHPSGLLRKCKMTSSGSIEHGTNSKQKRKTSKTGTTTTTLSGNNKLKQQLSQNLSAKSTIIPRVQNIKSSEINEMNQKSTIVSENPESPQLSSVQNLKAPPLATTPSTPGGNIVDMQGKITQTPVTTSVGTVDDDDTVVSSGDGVVDTENLDVIGNEDSNVAKDDKETEKSNTTENSATNSAGGVGVDGEYINSVGVRFTQQNSFDGDGLNPLLPYGLPCIQELFRFLILLCNPLDKQNTDTMSHMGLSLLTVALEVGADNIGKYDTLLSLVKDEMCRNLFSLLNSERLTIFAADLQLCFLLFESLRSHLKFQLEYYLNKLLEIISNDNPRQQSYEFKELALDNLLQLLRIPNFTSELYINYDCNLYCSDIFENSIKLLSKTALSATNSVYSIHTMSLDALITVIESIEKNCLESKNSDCNTIILNKSITRHSRNNSSLEGITIIDGDGNNITTTTTTSSTTTLTTINSSKIDNNTNSTIKITENNKNENNIDDIGDIDEKLSTTSSIQQIENLSTFIKNNSSSITDNKRCNYTNSILNNSNTIKISKDELINIKNKKRILTQGTELFNQRPDKGIQFLQENGILNSQLNPMEIALFLRDNHGLDKKMIGEFISKKKNVENKILENFVQSFDFTNLRIDLSLRLYLETFRLPGEAPLIFLVMEHFADHWHKLNGEPFANTDAAFRLAYAIIMLNMDQHNYNAKRLNVPMTPEDFLKNLRGLNGNKDFDQDMLLNIYNGIKNEEIVMPAEQTGIVRENYLWKVLLRRGAGKDGQYLHINDSSHDKELFNIVWGPSLAALSFMFDKSTDNGYQKSLIGFTKCASITSFYSLYEDFDALILTLCKFTMLLNNHSETMNDLQFTISFGTNLKAQSALKTVFKLIHDYGDCLRDSWKNILDIIIQLFKLKLLPKIIYEVEDFCEKNGKFILILDKKSTQQQQKSDIGLLSSLYSYLSSDGQRQPTYEEQEIIKYLKKFIRDCQIDQLIIETKFIQYDSLQELIKSIINLIKIPNTHKSIDLLYLEDITVFWLEFLVKIIIQNRDRIMPLWSLCRDQIYLLLMNSSSCGYDYLLNRTTIALLKLAIYLMRNEELCPIVLQSLKMLLMLKPNVIYRISKQISIGIYELLKTSAQNIHTETDWQIIFTTLECIGAGALPPEFEDGPPLAGTKSDGAFSSEEDSGLPDRGYISDSEVINATIKSGANSPNLSNTPYLSPSGENWILVNKDSEISVTSRPHSPIGSSLIYPCKLLDHLPFALFKCWDSLSFIVRNVAHITPYNFESCVRCIRTFVEAVLDGGIKARRKLATGKSSTLSSSHSRKKSTRRDSGKSSGKKRSSGGSGGIDENSSDSEDEELSQRYETLAIQLLDLMYTLYTRTAQIFRWWAEEGCTVPQCSALWAQGWCPILQGIARLAIDRRREVRTYAISCLQQRALLVHDLQTLTGTEWSNCFKQVLFPLLNELLPDSSSISQLDPILLEESRIRTATIMSKVFLHHLTPLIELPTFNDLWLEILDYIEKFMKVGSDMLYEQMLEILKNMLLVMHSVRVFHNKDGSTHAPLWELTWKRIEEFLPNLKDELFKDNENSSFSMNIHNFTQTVNRINISAATVNSPSSVIQSQQNQMEISQSLKESEVTAGSNIQNNLQQTENLMSSLKYETENSGTGGKSGMMMVGGSSIILKPPVDVLTGKQVIFGQASSSSQHNAPFLVPQTSTILQQQQQQQQQFYSDNKHSSSPTSQEVTIPSNVTQVYPISPLVQFNSASPHHPHHYHHHHHHQHLQQNDGRLPDLITDTSISVQSRVSSPPNTTASTSTSPDTTPHKESLSSSAYQITSNLGQQTHHQQYITSTTNTTNSIKKSDDNSQIAAPISFPLSSTTTNLYPQQYVTSPSSYSHDIFDQKQILIVPPGGSNDSMQTSSLEDNSPSSSSSVNTTSTTIVKNDSPRVPISHLLVGNQYPSLKKPPPNSIVQSFTPVYIQPQQQQKSGNDIYKEYVDNPYNLTLQQHHQQEQQQQQQEIDTNENSTDNLQNNQTNDNETSSSKMVVNTSSSSTTSNNQIFGISNVFQSANYFGGVIDQNSIPPGSEMLFGQP